MPTEFWKTICVRDSLTCQWTVCLCNKVWCNVHVPDEWHEALVSAIFKKGDGLAGVVLMPCLLHGVCWLGDLLRDAAKQRGNACAIAASAPPSVRSRKKVWAVMGEAWSPRTWRTTFAVQKNTFIRATSEPVLPHPILSMMFFKQKINPHCSAVQRIHIKRSLASFKFISATCFIPFLVRLAGQTVRFRGTTLYAKRIFVA